MKNSFLVALLALLAACSVSEQVPDDVEEGKEAAQPVYDSELAQELGADDYGMKMFVFANLKRGPNRDLDPEAAAELQRAHLDNIGRLVESGKLVLAGPFGDDGDIRGKLRRDVLKHLARRLHMHGGYA